MDAYFSINRGFFFLENFDDVLKEDRDSLQRETPQMAANNERRRQITAGLNLRRDKLAQSPIALFVFVPATTGELYAKTIMEKMPDLWSFRSLMLDLEKEVATAVSDITPEKYIPKAEIVNTDDTELRRLISLLDNTPETELAYRLTLYPQIVNAANDLGKYDLAFSTLDTWEQHVQDNEKPWIWIQKGDILNVFGKLEDALPLFEKAIEQASLSDDKNDVGLGHERLGYLYLLRGDLNNALLHFEKYKEIELELSTKTPSISMFKNNLAISYEKLGSTHTALGNLQQALKFFEDETQLFEELFKDYPNNVAFKNGLAISYYKLGELYEKLEDLEKAFFYFEKGLEMTELTFQSSPDNAQFKKNLKISYNKMGDICQKMGKNELAEGYFEKARGLGG
ncbi:MAG: tetratricopeptide repeat protein [Bacteroidetes bacterium]|nr:tetratricopeptide repeat protein [Bacteroidota bacterium]